MKIPKWGTYIHDNPTTKKSETVPSMPRSEIHLPLVRGREIAQASALPGMPARKGNFVNNSLRGYERGENVRAGKCPAPGWIK